MDKIVVNSVSDINIKGFDIEVTLPDGNVQVISDGVISVADGSLNVETREGEFSMNDLINQTGVNLEMASSVFLENQLFATGDSVKGDLAGEGSEIDALTGDGDKSETGEDAELGVLNDDGTTSDLEQGALEQEYAQLAEMRAELEAKQAALDVEANEAALLRQEALDQQAAELAEMQVALESQLAALNATVDDSAEDRQEILDQQFSDLAKLQAELIAQQAELEAEEEGLLELAEAILSNSNIDGDSDVEDYIVELAGDGVDVDTGTELTDTGSATSNSSLAEAIEDLIQSQENAIEAAVATSSTENSESVITDSATTTASTPTSTSDSTVASSASSSSSSSSSSSATVDDETTAVDDETTAVEEESGDSGESDVDSYLTLLLDSKDDSGTLGDFVTNVNTDLSFYGQTDPDTEVHFEFIDAEGNTAFEQFVTSDSSGEYLVELSSEYTDGLYTVSVTTTSASGEELSVTETLIIETQAPDSPTVMLSLESDTAASFNQDDETSGYNSDTITSDSTPTFEGTSEAGSTVTLYIPDLSIDSDEVIYSEYTTTASDDGTWSISLTSPLTIDGSYNYYVTSTDTAGNISAEATASFTLDTDVLQESGLLAESSDTSGDHNESSGGTSDGITSSTTPSFTGTVEDEAQVTLVISVDGIDYFITPTTSQYADAVSGDGSSIQSWAINTLSDGYSEVFTDIADGDYSYYFKYEDQAGNVVVSDDQIITIDTSAPSVTSSLTSDTDSSAEGSSLTGLDSDNITNDTQPSLGGETDANACVEVTVTSSDGTDSYSYVTYADTDGNWVVDLSVDEDGDSVNLSDDDYTIQVVATDEAGNSQDINHEIIIDTQSELSVTTDIATTTTETTPTLEGTSEANSIITITIYSTNDDGSEFSYTQSTEADENGDWELVVDDSAELSDGTYSYSLTAVDIAGNESEATEAITFTIDSTVEPFTVGLAEGSDTGSDTTDAITKDKMPTFSGTVEAGSSIEFTIDGVTYVLDSDGVAYKDSGADASSVVSGSISGEDWSITLNYSLSDSDYSYTAVATDELGNISSTLGGSITVDSTISATGGLDTGDIENSDSGSDNSDGITQDSTPTFTGTGTTGDTITVTVTSENSSIEDVVKTVTVDSEGNWTITFDEMNDGNYEYSIVASDVAGNSDTVVTDATLVIDNQGPSPLTGGLDESSDHLTTDQLTNVQSIDSDYVDQLDDITTDARPVLSGTVDATNIDTLVIYLDGDTSNPIVATLSADDDGDGIVDWDVDLEDYLSGDLSEGEHYFTVEATDLAGNVTTSDQIEFSVDTEINGLFTVNGSTGLITPNILDDSSDTGTEGDLLTSDATPTFSGDASSAEAGATIILEIDGNKYQTTANEDGSWSLSVDNALLTDEEIENNTEDSFSFTLTQIDNAGNFASVSDILYIDSGTEITVGSITEDNQDSEQDFTTNVTSPTVTGTAEEGATITFTINGTSYSVAVEDDDADGSDDGIVSWSADDLNLSGLTPTDVDEQSGTVTYEYTASSTDEAGNTDSETGTITIDTEVVWNGSIDPSLSLVVDNDGTTFLGSESVSFSGDIETDGSITVTVTKDGDSTGTEVDITINEDGSWYSDSMTLEEDAVYSYTIVATDSAGNEEVTTDSFTVDTTLPNILDFEITPDTGLSDTNAGYVSVDTDEDMVTSSLTPTVSGYTQSGNTVALVITDSEGNEYRVDAADIDFDTGNTQSVGGETFVYWSYDLTHLIDSDGDAVTLTNGTYTISATASSSTFTTESSVEIEIDTTAPVIDTSGDFSTNEMPTFNGSADDSGQVVTVIITSTDGVTEYYSETITVVADESWSITLAEDTLDDGAYSYTISSEDYAGNINTETGTVTIDSTGPVLTASLDSATDSGESSDDDITNYNSSSETNQMVISGIIDDPNAAISLEIDGTIYTDATISGNETDGYSWSVAVTSVLNDDTYSYTVTATDELGNASQVEGSVTVDSSISVTTQFDSQTNDESDDDVQTNDSTPVFSGTGDAEGDEITINVYTAEDSSTPAYTYSTSVNEVGEWSYLVDASEAITDGDYTYSVTATDTAGNSETIDGEDFTVDLSVSTFTAALVSEDSTLTTLTGGEDSDTSDSTPNFSGTVEVGSSVVLTIGGISLIASVDASGNWSITDEEWDGISLTDNDYSYVIAAMDEAGNSETISGSLSIDTELNFSGGLSDDSDTTNDADDDYANDNYTSVQSPAFNGMGDEGDTVTLIIAVVDAKAGTDDEETTELATYTTTVGSDNSWSIDLSAVAAEDGITYTLAEGEYRYTLTATDDAENSEVISELMTIDTTTVVSGQLTQNALIDTGESSSDSNTTNTSPTFTGTAEEGSIVVVTLVNDSDAADEHSETITLGDDATSWTLAFSGLNSDATYSYTITSEDIAGNTDTENGTLIIDNTAPDITINAYLDTLSDTSPDDESLVNNADSADLSADSITSDTTPTITGTAEAYMAVTVQEVGSDEVLTTTADESGNWSVTTSAYSSDGSDDGTHTFAVTYTDTAGNTITETISIELDTQISVTGDLEDDSDTGRDVGGASDTLETASDTITNANINATENANTLSFEGTGEIDQKVTLYIDNDGDNIDEEYTAIVDVDGNWSIDNIDVSALADGTYSYYIASTDIAGNQDATETQYVTLDRSAPTITAGLDSGSDSGVSDSDALTTVEMPTFSGTTDDENAIIQVTIEGDTVTATVDPESYDSSTGLYSWSVTWETELTEEKEYTYTVTATDVAGNETSFDQTYVYDNSVSTATVEITSTTAIGSENGDTLVNIDDDGLIFGGEVEADSTVTLVIEDSDGNETSYEASVSTDSDNDGLSSWSYTLTEAEENALNDGTYSYYIEVTDSAGNEDSSETDNFTVDTQVDDFTAQLDSDSGRTSEYESDLITNEFPLEFSGTAEAGSTVILTIDGYYYEAVFTDSTSWSVTVSESYLYSGTDSDLGIDGSANVWATGYDATTSLSSGDGEYDYSYIVKDESGTIIDRTDDDTYTDLSGTITTDTAVTQTVEADLSNLSSVDTGTYNSDGITQIRTPTFSGTTELNSEITITIYDDDDNELYSYTLENSDSEDWSFTITDELADDDYNYTIDITDKSGNETASASETVRGSFTVDNLSELSISGIDSDTDSARTIGDNTDGLDSDQLTNITPTIEGTSESYSVITLTLTEIDGSAITDSNGDAITITVTAEENGNWSIDLINNSVLSDAGLLDTDGNLLNDGTYSYTVSAVDLAGNTSATKTSSFQYDTTAQTDITFSGGLSDESDTGAYNDDGYTTEQSPTFNGFGEVGATVTLAIDDGTVSTVITSEDGSWSIDLSDEDIDISLAEGEYEYGLTITDDAGNSKVLNDQTLNVDLSDPTVSSFELSDASDSGDLDSDNITNDTVPTFEGSISEQGFVTLTVYGSDGDEVVVIEDIATDANGNWSYDLSEYDGNDFSSLDSDDTYSYTIIATDLAGNSSEETTALTFELDTTNEMTAEMDSGYQQDENSVASEDLDSTDTDEQWTNPARTTNDSTPSFSGTIESDDDEVVLTIYDDADPANIVFTTTIEAATDGTWSYELDAADALDEGDYSYSISSTDVAGNSKTVSSEFTVNIDSDVTIVSQGLTDDSDSEPNSDATTYSDENADNITNLDPEIEGTAVGADFISVVLESYTDNDGTTIALSESSYTYTTEVNDDGSWSIELDGLVNDDGSTDGSYSYKIIAYEGDTIETAAVTELTADNSTDGSNVFTFGIDTQFEDESESASIDGLLTVTSGEGSSYDATANGDITFTGTAEENSVVEISIYEVSDDGLTRTLVETITTRADIEGVDDSYHWEVDYEGLADGTYQYDVTLIDIANNTETVDSQEFVVDSSAATLSVTGLAQQSDTGDYLDDSYTNDITPTIEGTVDEAGTITLTLTNGSETVTVTEEVSEPGDWAVTVPSGDELSEGDWDYFVVMTDEVGNQTTSETYTFTIDLNNELTGEIDATQLNSAEISSTSETDGVVTVTQPATTTNNGEFSFTGEAEDGDVITLTLVSSDTGYSYETTIFVTTDSDADTLEDWSLTLSGENVVSVEGTYTYVISSTDLAGNEKIITGEVTYDVTESVVTATGVSDNTDSTTGLSSESDYYESSENDDNITNVVPTLEGTVSADAVTVYVQLVSADSNTLTDTSLIIDQDTSSSEITSLLSTEDSYIYIATISDTTNDAGTYDWSASVNDILSDADLGEGAYTYQVIAIDSSGNITVLTTDNADSESLENLSFEIDLTVETSTSEGYEHSDENDTYDDTVESEVNDYDHLSSNTTPIFSGYGESDAIVTVTIYDENEDSVVEFTTRVSSTDADGDGNFSWQIDTSDSEYESIFTDEGLSDGLLDGTYSYTIETTDIAGNTTTITPTNSNTFEIDVSVPTDLVFDMVSETGTAEAETADSSPLFEGSYTDDSAATVYLTVTDTNNAEVTYTVSVDLDADSSDWSIDLSDESISLDDGDYTYSIVVVDQAGNETVSSTQTFTVDTVNELTGELSSDSDSGVNDDSNYTNPELYDNEDSIDSTEITFTGTGEAGAIVTITLSSDDPGADDVVITDIEITEDGSWSYSLVEDENEEGQLVDGATYQYTISSTDSVGITKTIGNDGIVQTVTIDEAEVTLSSEDATTNYDFIVDKTAPDEATVDGLTFETDTAAETYTEATDDQRNDNISNATTVTVEGSFSSDEEDLIASVQLVLLTQDGSELDESLYSFTGDIDATNWTVDIDTSSLDDASYTYQVVLTDLAGNTSVQTYETDGTTTLSFELDTADPVDPTNDGYGDDDSDFLDHSGDDTDNITSSTTPTFTGFAEAGALVTLLFASGATYSAYADSGDGSWTINVTDDAFTEDGTYTYTVTTEDTAGNSSSVSSEFEIDTTAPSHVVVELQPDDSVEDDTYIDADEDGALADLSTLTTIVTDGNDSYTVPLLGESSPVFTVQAEADTVVTLTITDLDDANTVYIYYVTITEANTTSATYVITDASGTEMYTGSSNLDADGIATVSFEVDELSVDASGTAEYKYEVVAEDFSGNEASNVVIDTPTVDGLIVDAGYFALDTSTSLTASLSAASDTGSDDSDKVTKNQNLEFTGTAEEGATIVVEIFDSNGSVDSVTTLVDVDGVWSVTSNLLAEGDYYAVVTSTDTSGNQTTSTIEDITVDITEPTATDLLSASVTPLYDYTSETSDDDGNSGDLVTSSTTVSISGDDSGSSLEEGDVVTVYVYEVDEAGDAVSGGVSTTVSATVISDGSWVADVTLNVDDETTFGYSLSVVDAAGNTDDTSVSTKDYAALNTFTIDPFNIVFTEYENTSGDELTGDYQGSSTADFYTQSSTFKAVGTIDDNVSSWSISIVDSDGTALSTSAYTFAINDLDDSDGQQEWTLSFDGLDDDTYTYTITATDDNGFSNTLTNSVTVDNVATSVPTVSLINGDAPSYDGYDLGSVTYTDTDTGDYNLNQLTFSGTAEAYATVTLYFTSTSGEQDSYTLTTSADANGNWTLIVDTDDDSVPEGTYYYSFIATDLAGNDSDASDGYLIDYDTTAPVFDSVVLTADEVSSDGVAADTYTSSDNWWVVNSQETLSITFSVSDENSNLDFASFSLTIGGVDYSSSIVDNSDGTYTIDLSSSGLDFGKYKVIFTAIDTNGNETAFEKTLTYDESINVTVELAAASDTGDDFEDSFTADTTPTITGVTDAYATVTIYESDGLTLVGTTAADVSGVWNYTFSTLTSAEYTYVVVASDSDSDEDNLSEARSVTFTVDADAPVLSYVKVSSLTDSDEDGDSDDYVDDSAVTSENATSADTEVPDLDSYYNWVRIEGTVDDTTATVRIYVGGQWHSVDLTTSGSYSLDISLEAGASYDYYVEVTDIVGNVTTSNTGTINVLATAVTIDANIANDSALQVTTDESGQEQLIINSDVGVGSSVTLTGTTAVSTEYIVFLADANGDALTDSNGDEVYYYSGISDSSDGSWSISDIDLDDYDLEDGYQFILTSNGRTDSIEVVIDTDISISSFNVLGDVENSTEYFSASTVTGDLISGATEADATITLVLTNETTGDTFDESQVNVSVDADGNFTISNGDAVLTDGSYSYEITATDSAGNTTTISSSDSSSDEYVSFVVDTSAPEVAVESSITINAIDEGDLSTVISSGSITPENTVSLSGTIDITNDDYNQVILVVTDSEGSDITYIVRSDDDSETSDGVSYDEITGEWSLELSELVDGDYSYTLISEDSAGNQTEQTADDGAFTVKQAIASDDLTYSLSYTQDTDTSSYETSDSTFDVTVSTASDSDITVTAYLYANGTEIETKQVTIVNTDGEQTITFGDVGDSDEQYQIELVVSDIYGNRSTENITIDYDGSLSTLALIMPEDTSGTGESTSDTTVEVTGITEDSNGWMYSVDGGDNWYVGSSTYSYDSGSDTYSATFELTDSNYDVGDILVKQTDSSGNESTVTASTAALVVDTSAPEAVALSLSNDTGVSGDYITTDGTVTVSNIESGATWTYSYTLDGTPFSSPDTYASSDSSFILSDTGTYTDITVTVTDGAGNETTTTLSTLTVTDTNSSISIALNSDTGDSASDNLSSDGTINVSDVTSGNNWLYSIDSGTTWYIGSGSSFELSDGTYASDSIMVKEVSTTGETVTTVSLSTSSDLTIDTSAPEAVALSLSNDTGVSGDYITTDGTVTVSNIESGATWTYSYTLDGTPFSSPDTYASSDSSFILSDTGTYTDITVTVTDGAGNETTTTLSTLTVTDTNSSISIALNSDTGDSASDNLSSDGTINVSDVTSGNNWLYSIDSGTTWYIGSGSSFELSDGTYASDSIMVKEVSTTGETVTTVSLSTSSDLTIDTSAPEAVALSLSNDTGVSGDYITTDGTVTVSNIESGATWTYSYTLDGTPFSSPDTYASSDSSFILSDTGTYTDITVTVTDGAGNETTTTLSTLTVTDTNSSISIALNSDTGDSASDNLSSDGTINVSDVTSGNNWLYSIDSGTTWYIGSGSSFELSDGTYASDSIMVKEVSTTGETVTTVSLTMTTSLIIDTTSPSVSAVSIDNTTISGYATEDLSLTFAIDEDGDTTIDSIQTIDVEVSGDGSWSLDVESDLGLTDSAVDLYLTEASDSAGNSIDNLDILLLVDTQDPTLTDFTIYDDVSAGTTDDTGVLSDGDWTNDNQPTFEGTTEGGATVSLTIGGDSYDVTADQDGLWSITVGTSLSDGSYSYSIDIADSTGNTLDDAATGTLNVDTVAPSYESLSYDGSTVSFTATDGDGSSDDSGVSSISALLGGNTDVDITSFSGLGDVTIDTTSVDTSASNHLVVTITDAAGNESQVDTDI
ncbi:Ig-like domain-containing protein [Vibrio algarum]|uniref:Ig-like domain-containing protein n=1 Tax=Vibrio algarum TaxID=3020714 RepID=A0ABT4YS78_9VIBR|nr:Ig-like domain-containing protein [Vibrio sp. KJ40-1]MDB1124245.1 Ig-like domain-containing protein [Vibrio sp. KJ40-1]